MPNGRNEPQCWTCLHFASIGSKKCCSLHQVVLPIELGHYLICRKWQDEPHDSSTTTRWKEEYLNLKDTAMLYKYDLYSPRPAIPVVLFTDLEKCL